MQRHQLTDNDVNTAYLAARSEINRRLKEKGRGILVTTHEILGVVTEEYHELVNAVTAADPTQVADELYDLAVACLVGAASMETGETQW